MMETTEYVSVILCLKSNTCDPPGPMLMITEYCRHGDLLNFLRVHVQDIMVSMWTVKDAEDEVFYKNLPGHNSRLRRYLN